MKNIIVILLLFITTTIFAQDTVLYNTSEISVEGIRADENIPITKTNIDSSLISKYDYNQEISNVLSKTPNIFSSADGGNYNGYTYIRLRGMEQTRINWTLNSIPLNEPEDQGVYTSNYVNFINNITDIQIQRGVGITSNGVSSYIGSINYLTVPKLYRNGGIDFQVGSFGTVNGNVYYNSGLINNKWNFYINASMNQSDGYRYHSDNQSHSVFLNGSYNTNKSVLSLISFYGKSKNGMAWLPSPIDSININPKHNTNLKDERDNFDYLFNTLQYSYSVNNNINLFSSIYLIKLKGWYNYFVNTFNDINIASNYYGYIFNLNYNKNSIDFNSGFSISNYDREHYGQDEFVGNYTNNGNKKDISVYGKLNYSLNKFNLFGNVQYRYNDFRYSDITTDNFIKWNFVNSTFGINYNYSDNGKLYSSFGLSNREPARTDILGGNEYYNYNWGNWSDIKPEKVYDLEIGYQYSLNNLLFKVNGYWMEFTNEIISDGTFGNNSLLTKHNVPTSYRGGVELESRYDINKYVSVLFNASYLNAKVRSYDTINTFVPIMSPKFMLNSNINYHTKDVEIGTNIKYVDIFYIDNLNINTNPASCIFDIYGKLYLDKFTTISLGVNNIFNSLYFTGGNVSSNGTRNYFVGGGINAYFNIKFIL